MCRPLSLIVIDLLHGEGTIDRSARSLMIQMINTGVEFSIVDGNSKDLILVSQQSHELCIGIIFVTTYGFFGTCMVHLEFDLGRYFKPDLTCTSSFKFTYIYLVVWDVDEKRASRHF